MRGDCLTAEEVAAKWKTSKTEVYRMAQRGDLPAFRSGRRIRFWSADIEAYEKSNTH